MLTCFTLTHDPERQSRCGAISLSFSTLVAESSLSLLEVGEGSGGSYMSAA